MNKKRFPMMLLALLSLLAGILTGLWRAGWKTPFPHDPMFNWHGALMVCGFLGTLIGMERAVAYGRFWGYLAPVFAGVGGVMILIDRLAWLAPVLETVAAAVLLALLLVLSRRVRAIPAHLMTLGGISWLIGNGLWLAGWTLPQVAPFWIGFLMLTIAGERWELSRILQPDRRAVILFWISMAVFFIGLGMSLTDHGRGMQLLGIGMAALGVWLIRFDLARKNLHQSGLYRFMGISLISGYAWLVVAGLLAYFWGMMTAGFRYDAVMHSFFLGFVFTMIFAHAPIVFPAILNVKLTYSNVFYTHLILLHLSLIYRIVADWQLMPGGRILGGWLNGVAILLFFINTLTSVQKKEAQS